MTWRIRKCFRPDFTNHLRSWRGKTRRRQHFHIHFSFFSFLLFPPVVRKNQQKPNFQLWAFQLPLSMFLLLLYSNISLKYQSFQLPLVLIMNIGQRLLTNRPSVPTFKRVVLLLCCGFLFSLLDVRLLAGILALRWSLRLGFPPA